MRTPVVLAAAAAVAAALAPGLARADTPVLTAVVGPGFTISLSNADGTPVTHLPAGPVTIAVDDRSSQHDFHLVGPGVDQATDVDGTGTASWNVTLQDGTYTFRCDPHASLMHGSFTVGAVTQDPAAPPPAPAPSPAPRYGPAATTVVGSVGPGFSIALRTTAGAAVRTLPHGAVTLVVNDLSAIHDFHLTGPGVDRRTSVKGTGRTTWKLTLAPGTYRYVCDPHARVMHGSFRVT